MNENKDISKTQEKSLFNRASNDYFIFKKTEKIAGATHYITGVFDDKEPLKMSLRKCSLTLVSLSLSLIKNSDTASSIGDFSARLVELRSLLRVAVHSKLFSDKNFEIMASEIDALLDTVEAKKTVVFSLPSSYFETSVSPIKESIKDISRPTPVRIEQRISPRSDQALPESREVRILSILKTRSDLTIKDIAVQFKDCGEKTIQRELIRLVSESKVLKRGERRWSKYSLF